MAVKTTAFFVFFVIGLLSIFTTKTLATFKDPVYVYSCRMLSPGDDSNFPKCYAEYKATNGLANATEFAKAVDATSRARNLVVAANDKSEIVEDLFGKFEYNRELPQADVKQCMTTWKSATAALRSALYVMRFRGHIALHISMLQSVQESIQIAVQKQNEVKCTIEYSPRGVVHEAKRTCNNALNACKEIPSFLD